MSFLISDAWAQAAPATTQQGLLSFLPLVALFVVFYFFLAEKMVSQKWLSNEGEVSRSYT